MNTKMKQLKRFFLMFGDGGTPSLNEYTFTEIATNVYETKSYIGEGTTTRVPIEHGGGSVVGIGSETFTDNTTIQSVIVSNGIEKIR